MPLEIPCPQCGAILRVPDGSAGRKARCKKCRHGFRLPGEPPAEASDQESQQLSVVDAPAFSFETPAVSHSKSSKSKYKSSITGSHGSKPKSKASLFVIFGILAIGGIIAAIYFSMDADKPKDIASAASPKAVPEKPTDPPKEKEAAKKTDPKPSASKPLDKKGKVIPAMTGGLKLPAPPAKAEKLQKHSHRVSVETPFANVRRVFVSGGESPLAAVIWPSDKGFSGQNAKDTVDRYNLDSGARIDRTEIDAGDGAWPRACDLSPNADRFVCEGPVGTLSLYNLNEKAKAGMPFKPFVEDDKTPVPPLAAAFFLDETSVLVAAKDGRLETWKDGKRTGSGSVGGAVTERSLALKTDRKTLIAMTGANLVSLPTGSLIASPGQVLPASPLECYAISSGSGDRVAVLYQASVPGLHTLLFVARLDDAKPTSVPLDASYGIPEQIDWNGAETFTFATDVAAVAFEMESKRPMAALRPSGKAKHILAHGRHSVMMPDPANDKKSLLVVVGFPPDDYLPLINEAKAASAPVGFLLTPEGFGR